MPKNIDKASALKLAVQKHGQADFYMAIGDDSADEPMFDYINSLNKEAVKYAITVGRKASGANYFATNVDEVLKLLTGLQ